MGDFQTGGMFGSTNMSTQVSGSSDAAVQKDIMRDSNSKYDTACAKTDTKLNEKQQAENRSDIADSNHSVAVDRKNAADSNLSDAKQAKTDAENNKKSNNEAIESNNQQIEENNKAVNETMDKIRALRAEGSPESIAEADAQTSKLEQLSDANEELRAKNKEKAEENKAIDEGMEGLDTAISTAESNVKKAEENLEKKKEAKQKADNDKEAADKAYDEAVVEENGVLDEQAEKYPDSFGKEAEIFKDDIKTLEDDKKQKDKETKDAENAEAELDKTDELWSKHDDEVDALGLDEHYDEDAALECETRDCLNKLMNDAKKLKGIADYKAAKDAMTNASTPAELKAAAERLEAAKKIPGVEQALGLGITGAVFGGQKATYHEGQILWDAPTGAVGVAGRMDEEIANRLQPKYKHAYWGEFPTHLDTLNWMVKSMDRPKIDIEYVEQLRNNVKRIYPIKYNFGDVSMTFWDNTSHKTIKTIYKYFANKIWYHPSTAGTGFMMLRDSTVIPTLIIWDLSTSGEDHLKYVFENIALASYDFDANEDETDEGVHTIQCVFKFERFEVIPTKAAPAGLGVKSVTWL